MIILVWPTIGLAKRSNRTVFIDDEAAFILRRWLRVREGVNRKKETAPYVIG